MNKAQPPFGDAWLGDAGFGDAGDPALAKSPAPGGIARTRRRAVVTIAIGFTLLLLTGSLEGLIVWQSDRKLGILQDAWLLHDATNEVLTELLDAESGQRGYLLVADPRYLEFYMLAEQKLPAAMARSAGSCIACAWRHHIFPVDREDRGCETQRAGRNHQPGAPG